MRKYTYSVMVATALLVVACKPEKPEETQIAPPVPVEPAEEAPAAEPGAVGKALSVIPSVNGAPAADADYYIYLESASWCGPCRAEMPHIVKAYPEMKKQNVELVLIGYDDSKASTEEYLKTFNATFPGIFNGEQGVKDLPGYTPASGIPHATIVDRDGKVIANGHGSIVMRWQDIIKG